MRELTIYSGSMQRTTFGAMACSVARTLEVIGEPWTLLILRDIFVGIDRFGALQKDLGISRKVLTERLRYLVAEGILDRSPYQQRPPRFTYALTDQGRDLLPILVSLMKWGDRWTADDAAPMRLQHSVCGELITGVLVCECCNQPLRHEDLLPLAGPGGRSGPGTAVIGQLLADVSRLSHAATREADAAHANVDGT